MCVTLNPGTPGEQALYPLQTLQLHAGDCFMVEMAGGGGYGDPLQRDAEQVSMDVQNGYVSLAGAERDYGVAIDPETLHVDEARTCSLRASA